MLVALFLSKLCSLLMLFELSLQMDCIIFFTAIASLIKVGVNLPLILDVWRDKLWLRIAIEQTYW